MNRNTYHWENQYLLIANDILRDGDRQANRTGVDTLSLFAPPQIDIDLQRGFPAVTTKKLNWKTVVTELLWILRGSHSTAYLRHHGVNLWDPWATETGYVGRVYGPQLRSFGAQGRMNDVDQLKHVIEGLREAPTSRRHVVSYWDSYDLAHAFVALPPCPVMWQVQANGALLNMHVYQRSADWFLGVPFDIAQYALLTHLLAGFSGLQPGRLVFSYGDAHIYTNHIDQITRQLQRQPFEAPALAVTRAPDVYSNLDPWLMSTTPSDFTLNGYAHYSPLRGKVAV